MVMNKQKAVGSHFFGSLGIVYTTFSAPVETFRTGSRVIVNDRLTDKLFETLLILELDKDYCNADWLGKSVSKCFADHSVAYKAKRLHICARVFCLRLLGDLLLNSI